MLLFKLYTLQITKSQIDRLLTHPDSSYIRAIGLLYLRHCCDPKQLFGWRATARSVRTSRVCTQGGEAGKGRDAERWRSKFPRSPTTTKSRGVKVCALFDEYALTPLVLF